MEIRKTESYAKWLDGREVVVLLAGGAKRSQASDIKTCLRLARNL